MNKQVLDKRAMGDSTDGSSSAAQRAQAEDHTPSQPTANKDADQPPQNPAEKGFLARLFSGSKSKTEKEPQVPAPNGHLPTGDLRNLTNMRLEDVAVPRADITAVPQDMDMADMVKVFKDSGYSRLPVFKDALDNPLGFIHLKDFALKYGFNGTKAKFSMKRMLRPLLFAPPSMTIGVLLQKMQADRVHMALVIDEYGGVDGLITIEDLVETVLGEIVDEHDTEEEALWVEESSGVFLAQARANLEEFEQAFGTSLTAEIDDEEIDTLGGLVFMLTGRIPAKGEIVPHPAGLEFEVVDADPRRIKRLRIKRGG